MIETEEKVHSAIYAGSFDPPTRGHENIIVRASKMFDVLYVAMAHNPSKKSQFWTETRYKMLDSIIRANGLTNVKIITITSKELTVEKAHELGASVLIRGCRDGVDFDYEVKLALSNRRLAPDIETFILPPEPEFYYTSSTSARQAIDLIFANKVKEGYSLLKDIVPECTYKYFNFYVGCPGKDGKDVTMGNMLTVNKKQLCEDEHIAAGFRLCEVIRDYGYDAYLVGGCVRDILFNKHVHDVDVATNMPMNELNNKFYCQFNNGEKHGTILVNIAGDWIETTQFRMDGNYSDGRHPDEVKFSQSFEEDTKRRDFTINAIGFDADGKIVDYQGGQKDLENNLIRAVGNPEERFNEDALRILRAIRFAARFDFTIESKTGEVIKKCKDKLTLIARERIGDEIKKAASYGIYEFYRFIDMLIDYQLTDIIDPGHFVNWIKAKKLLCRYLETSGFEEMRLLTNEQFVQQNLAFLLAHSSNIVEAIKEFRYDNKLLDVCKFIRKYQDLCMSDINDYANSVRFVELCRSKHLDIFLNYTNVHCMFELTKEQLELFKYIDEKLKQNHDIVAKAIDEVGVTGKYYGIVLTEYEEWFCAWTFKGKEPTEQEIIAHIKDV